MKYIYYFSVAIIKHTTKATIWAFASMGLESMMVELGQQAAGTMAGVASRKLSS